MRDFIEENFETVQDILDFIDDFEFGNYSINCECNNKALQENIDKSINAFLEKVKNVLIDYLSAKKIPLKENMMGEIELEDKKYNYNIDYEWFNVWQ